MDKNKVATKIIVGSIVTSIGFAVMKSGVSRIIEGVELFTEGLASRIKH